MKEEYQDPYLEEFEDDEEESPIDWVALVRKVLSRKWFIVIFTGIFFVLGCVIALQMDNKWEVTVSLAPEAQSGSKTGAISSITSMLGMGSSALSGGVDALNITLAPEICESTPFLTQLFDVQVNPTLSQSELEDGGKPGPMSLYTYLSKEYMPKKSKPFFVKWIDGLTKDEDESNGRKNDTIISSRLTRDQMKVVKFLTSNIAVDVNSKTGVTTIQVTMPDPVVAAALADTVCQRLQDYISQYRTRKALRDYEYYAKQTEKARQEMIQKQSVYAHSVDYDQSVILQSVKSEQNRLEEEADLAQQLYSTMKQQEEAYRAKVQEMRPVFAVIQPAVQPLRPVGGRKKVALAFGFLGLILSCGWVMFLKDAIKNFRTKLKEEPASSDKLVEAISTLEIEKKENEHEN